MFRISSSIFSDLTKMFLSYQRQKITYSLTVYTSPGCMQIKQYTELLYPHLLSFSVSALKIYWQDQTYVRGIVENNV